MSEKVLITPAELSDMVKTEPTVVIDTRDPATYAAGHLPDAVNIHDIFTYLATSTPDGVAAMREKFASIFGAAGLSGAETAVVYEQSMNTGFGQSCRGYVLLRYLGYPKIKILHGGYVAWTAAGMPTSTAVPTLKAKSFPLDPSAAGILVDLQNMKAAVADPNIVKLDTRDVDEWIANSSSPYGKDFCPRKGRIPGAVWLEWYRMMKPTPNGPMSSRVTKFSPNAPPSASRPRHRSCSIASRARELRTPWSPSKKPASRTLRSVSARGTNGRAIRPCRSKPACRTRRRPRPASPPENQQDATGVPAFRPALPISGHHASALPPRRGRGMKGHTHGNLRRSL